MKENCLLVFLSSPSADKIDANLKEAFGVERACQIYVDMAKQIFATANKLDRVYAVAVYEGNSAHPDLRWLDSEDPGFLTKKGSSQAEWFYSAVKWAFDAGAKRVITLSVLAPAIPQDWIEKAFQMLQDKQIVFGPTQEGECYLLGMNSVYNVLFEDYPWTGKRFADEITERAKKTRLSVYAMPEFYTVKDDKSYQQWTGTINKNQAEHEPSDLSIKQKNKKHKI